MLSIKVTGLVEALTHVRALGEAASACNGPLATFGNLEPYAFGIETGRTRGGRRARAAGGAFMFRDGVRETVPFATQQLQQAIPKGARALATAKGQIRTRGVENIRARTPVRSGRLRAGVRELNRPG